MPGAGWTGATSKNSRRGSVLDDEALRHEHAAVGDAACECELVGDDDHRHAGGREILHDLQHLVDQFRVERTGRLVEEQDARVRRDRAGDGDPLLLAAGELARVGRGLVGEADPVEQFEGARTRVRRPLAVHLDRRLGDVAQHGPMREQVELLEDHSHPAALPLDVGIGHRPQVTAVSLEAEQVAVEVHRSSVDGLEQVDAPDQRGLARAGGPEDRDHLGLLHPQVDAAQRDLVSERLAKPDDLENGVLRLVAHSATSSF